MLGLLFWGAYRGSLEEVEKAIPLIDWNGGISYQCVLRVCACVKLLLFFFFSFFLFSVRPSVRLSLIMNERSMHCDEWWWWVFYVTCAY